MEHPRDKFVRLAEKRVTRVLKDIQLVGNLSNRKNYEYSEEDIKKIVYTIQKELNNLKIRFEMPPKKMDFKLK